MSEALLLLLGTALGGVITLVVQYAKHRWSQAEASSQRIGTARRAERERQVEPIRGLISSMNRLTAQVKLERTMIAVVEQAARHNVDQSVWDVITPSLEKVNEYSAANQIFGVDQARSEALRAAPTDELRSAIDAAYLEAMLYFQNNTQDVPIEQVRRLTMALEDYLAQP